MSILKDIEDVGLDIFISYHPIVIKLKRESKTLHKELKPQGFSLMQCQEVIAKRYGFNNWYHFCQLIKKHYQVGLEKIPFIITPKLEKNDNFLIGYDINFGHYKWQDENSMRTHQCIIGKDIFKNYDVFLACQAIEKGNEVFFLNGVNDIQTLHSLKYKAITCNRKENLKIIDGSSIQKFYNHFSMGSGALTELFNSCLDTDGDGGFIMDRTLCFLSSLIMALTYRRDTDKTILPLELIKEYLDLDKFIKLSKGELPEVILVSMHGYLNSLPDFSLEEPISESSSTFHIKLTKKISNVIDDIISLNILSNDINSIHISRLLDRDRSIYIFNAEKKVHHQFLTSLLKQSFAKKLGADLDNDRHIRILTNRLPLFNIFIREISAVRGMGVVSAQARSLRLSLTYSYSSLTKMKEILGVECDSILANTNTKIIGAKENDAIDYLNLYKKEVTLNNVDWSTHIKDEQIKNNYVWVMKRDDVSQVSFSKEN